MPFRRVILVLLTLLTVYAPAKSAAANPTCITIQRGSGGVVADAHIGSDRPVKNFGSTSALSVGSTPTGVRQSLLRFDLAAIPAGATITSAVVTLDVVLYGGAAVRAHRITAPWSEASVTWSSFGGAFLPQVDATFPIGSPTSADFQALVQAWVSGSLHNYGILLERDLNGTTVFASSEESLAKRPRLNVCYTPAVVSVCGDGAATGAEACDDSNTLSGDGCSAACSVEDGFICSGSPSACATFCGDATVAGTEACDDGDTMSGDGCSATCSVEGGFTCTFSPSICAPTCGDGLMVSSEACDDSNTVSGDGCNAACSVESGFTCSGSPSTCSTTCGDGIRGGSEGCDDGNAGSGDGCSAACTVEVGFTCGGSPSACTCANGTPCNDGSACTQSDTCQGGICIGASPVACAASDQCHTAGTCNPATGQCSNPTAANGAACNDGNSCTQSDTCQGGACTGASPVACAASDQCHAAGTCNSATGQCSNPALANGAACSDGDACTQSDTCQSGTCAGASPVACAALDACHTAGACNPATGQCSTPAAADGTACNDGNACTQSDTCQAGACSSGAPIVCTAATLCTTAGACDPTTGQCSNPSEPNGKACNDGVAATEFDTCVAGACTGASSVVITVQSPLNGAIASANTVLLTGTISEPATVTIGTVNAAVNGLSFSATVALHEGNNIIALAAKSALGYPGSASVVVVHDSTRPRIAITAPANNAFMAGNTATVTGTVQDLLIGTVNPGDCSVTVNGVAATVENRGFRAVNVPIAEGAGTITAIATDLAGNTASTVLSVTGNMTSNALIFAAGGDAQSGIVATTLAQPFTAFVADNTGKGIAGIDVTFKVTRSNGVLANGARSETVTSNAQGFASTTLTLGSTTGAASDQVVATASAFLGAATFAADGLVDPVGQRVLTVGSGGLQRGAVDTLAAQPLGVLLADDKGNPITGQDVTFTVLQGGGRVDGSSSIKHKTDTDGRAFVLLSLGSASGEGSQLVQATAAGANDVQFLASTVIAGPPSDTHVSGVVMTNQNDPILNVDVSIKGTSIHMLTDAEGHFDLLGAPVGPVHLEINGGTAGPYPTISFDLALISGVDNPMDRPIYLPLVDTDGLGSATPTADLVLRREDVPGLVLTVTAGSATFNGVAKTGTVQIVNVHNDKLPMLPSDGAMPTQAFAIMPHGATFDPPAAIRFPNVDGRAPGEVVQIYSYDHDLGTFVVVGTAQVSEDGLEIASESGQGIVKGGWHYVPPVSPQPGTVCSTGNQNHAVKCTDANCLYTAPGLLCSSPFMNVCVRGRLGTGSSSGRLLNPPLPVACYQQGETCTTDDDCCASDTANLQFPATNFCTNGFCIASAYDPDVDCWESKLNTTTCPPGDKGIALTPRAPGVPCTRGYDPAYPALQGQVGECVGKIGTIARPATPTMPATRTCCPTSDPSFVVCHQTGQSCSNNIDDDVCCPQVCINNCCP